MMKVERIQYQTALAVTGTWKGTSRMKLYEQLGWESLHDRRMCRRVLQIYKIINNKTPLYLREKLPPNRRMPYVFQEIRCRTSRYKNSFFPDAISTWNNIISMFEDLPTESALKKRILACVRPIPKTIYGVYNPSSTRYLFQLRVGLSNLKSHKKQHNFLDTPSDTCNCKQGIEDTRHFLLDCPFYAIHRETLSTHVNDILRKNQITPTINDVQVYLYGHPSLSVIENRSILNATIDYIDKTNRFPK